MMVSGGGDGLISEVPLYFFKGKVGVRGNVRVVQSTKHQGEIPLSHVVCRSVQRYLAHKKKPNPYDHPRTIDIGLR
jgi:hypothetical protein